MTRYWLKALRRRSQKTRVDWTRMVRIRKRWLPPVCVMHPFPEARFLVTTQGRSGRYLEDKAGLHRYTITITEPAQLSRALASTRKSGTGSCYEEMTLGAVSVASPIVGNDGQVTAALGIVAHSRADLNRLASAVSSGALSTSRAIC